MIEIVEYRSSWPLDFRDIARCNTKGLGDLALRIDHIGSTSVPGLCAKDVIDQQITVAALDARVTTALHALGYSQAQDISRDHRPPDDAGPEADWTKLFFRAPQGQRRTHTHVRVTGKPNQRYAAALSRLSDRTSDHRRSVRRIEAPALRRADQPG